MFLCSGNLHLSHAIIVCYIKGTELTYGENSKEYWEFANIHLFNKIILKAYFVLYKFPCNLS